ncbi:MAG TPA: hypothetical protein VN376_04410, partial [Longilinea sp.]|nr:hypothetical protein [Longilinea sp.]
MENPNTKTRWYTLLLRFLKYFFLLYVGAMALLILINWIGEVRDLYQIGINVFWAGVILVALILIAFTN